MAATPSIQFARRKYNADGYAAALLVMHRSMPLSASRRKQMQMKMRQDRIAKL